MAMRFGLWPREQDWLVRVIVEDGSMLSVPLFNIVSVMTPAKPNQSVPVACLNPADDFVISYQEYESEDGLHSFLTLGRMPMYLILPEPDDSLIAGEEDRRRWLVLNAHHVRPLIHEPDHTLFRFNSRPETYKCGLAQWKQVKDPRLLSVVNIV